MVLCRNKRTEKCSIIMWILGVISKKNYFGSPCHMQHFTPVRYCPQHNVYMQYLTCKEHLEFFGRLRGLTASKANEQANELLVKLKLADSKDEYGKQLSGGMKRRLCLAMTIIGEKTLIILDEPFSGLDIESRRILRDILLDLGKNTRILITTHDMEDAEVLGDKIAILMNGTSLETRLFLDCGTP